MFQQGRLCPDGNLALGEASAAQSEMAKLVPGNIEVSSKFEESHKMKEQAFHDVERGLYVI